MSETPATSEVIDVSNVSAISEMGNIVSCCFLDELSDATGLSIRPSQPIFAFDLLAAMMQTVLLEQGFESDKAIVIDTLIKCQSEGISFNLLFLPTRDLFNRIGEETIDDE